MWIVAGLVLTCFLLGHHVSGSPLEIAPPDTILISEDTVDNPGPIDDVIFSEDVIKGGLTKRGATLNIWPSSTDGGKRVIKIPYSLGDGLTAEHNESIKRAIAEYKAKTCIRWIPRSGEPDYLIIKGGKGCVTSLGRERGAQTMTLGRGCQYKGNVLHEMMHTLGFFHEQNREDRDSYVTIHGNQIKTGFGPDFDKYPSTIVVPEYDYHSLLQYERTAFAKNKNSPTITAKSNSAMNLGNKNDFSKLDLKRINTLYGCSEASDDYENYEVTVTTDKTWYPRGEGTDAYVYMELIGGNGKSGESDVASGGSTNDFERGATETFLVAFKYVGNITKLRVRLVAHGSHGDWKPSSFVIKDPRGGTKTFSYSGWMSPGKSYTL